MRFLKALSLSEDMSVLHDWVRRIYRYSFDDPRLQSFYGHSGYLNFGYWTELTRSAAQAGDNLVERLLALAPHKGSQILDVACGEGGTTARLLKHYDSNGVTAINVASDQLEAARLRVPGVRFIEMDATHLEFPPASLDILICVEAAFHFNTRERFLTEALRVLNPRANYLEDATAYERLLRRVGFETVHVVEARRQTFEGWARAMRLHMRQLGWYARLRGAATEWVMDRAFARSF